MDVSYILDELNDAQRQAVCAPKRNMLVLAGAGSGKTRVLVHRIAWLIKTEEISPFSILAVTFTNKAASEMRNRIEELLQMPVGGTWVGTFHSLAHRLLRLHWQDANLPQSFQILDSDDQYRTVRRVIRDLELDEARWPPKQAQWFINGKKDEGLRPEHVEHYGDPFQQQMLRIYQAYEAMCQRAGLVDFAELLFRAHELWLHKPQVLQHYQQRFKQILVDEFQDTNAIQYAWIRMLAGKDTNVFAVGDDDQSIYGWRGARIENIQQFSNDYSNTQTVRLEQNYRSSGTILKAANALISNNLERLGKNLWTADDDGEAIQLYRAINEHDEARFIVNRIQTWVEQGGRHDEAAILYRSNAQSRVIEEALIQSGMPYRVYGGLRFFDRAEIKDALAYMRLIANRNDDAAFGRIVNTPTRGIGDKTVSVIRDYARTGDLSLMQASHAVIEDKRLSARASNAVKAFLSLIETVTNDTSDLELHELIEHVIHTSTLYDYYDKDKSEKGQGRIENLQELLSAAQFFEKEHIENEHIIPKSANTENDKHYHADNHYLDDENQGNSQDKLSAFLSHAALESGEGQAGDQKNSVQLMTLHSAKGLEFPVIFLCGVEEGLFPHQRSVEEPGRLEEERRLCYVGVTRAKEQLYITHAEVRRLYGSESYPRASRFIKEIPPELIHDIKISGTTTHASVASNDSEPFNTGTEFALGQRVCHAKFGEGVVLNYEGEGNNTRVQVNFSNAGSKWLVVAYANLSIV
ncbi:MAG: DNA helicase II [Gammaproteobacteria bacterium]|nr:DNA helicase II [Gammaproteobacteria bacterium]